MNCPKCKAKLMTMEAGYASAKGEHGDAAPIAGHVTCWRCGYYKDIEDLKNPKAAISRRRHHKNEM